MSLQKNMLKFKKQHLCMLVINKVETFCDIYNLYSIYIS